MAHFKGLLGLIVCSFLANCAFSQMISGEVLSVSHGRNLRAYQLPSRKCKVDFMKTDYSPLGACHAPFPASVCCEGFKEIACAAVDLINDIRTDCATNMFIGIYRHNPFLPPDYFRNTCVEGPNGLDCLPIFQAKETKRGGHYNLLTN